MDNASEAAVRQLIAVRGAVSCTRMMSEVLSTDWFGTLEAELAGGATPATLRSDPAGVFAALLDGPKDLLSTWDSRLWALASVPFKGADVSAKLN